MLLKKEYENPFIWCRVFNEDYLYLVKHYAEINFKNFELCKFGSKIKNKTNPFYINVDNKISIHYSHYYFDCAAEKPLIIKKHEGADFYYNKIWETVVNNYEKRLGRMTGEPIFVFNDDQRYQPIANKKWTDIVPQLIELSKKIKNKMIIISNHYKERKENNLLILNSKNIYPPFNLKNNERRILEFIQE
jgi:hypothetical protein